MEYDRPPLPASDDSPDDQRERRRRKTMRIVMSFWMLIGGLVIVIFMREWTIDGISAPYVGYLFIGVGVLALLGVNVFWGGPLDKRRG